MAGDALEATQLLEELHALGVRYFCGVPDSVLGAFCRALESLDNHHHVIAANEGSAVALGVGEYLASDRVPVIYLQSSGIGNAINPLLSIADPGVYGIPLILLIGWRGEPGTRDEPQHMRQGRELMSQLATCCIEHWVLGADGADWREQLAKAYAKARDQRGPVAVCVRRGLLSKTPPRPDEAHVDGLPSREQAIQLAVEGCAADTLVVATTGMASRELFELRARSGADHGQDFYNVGGMGHASQIALALARRQTHRRVLCLDGDGAALMHLGGLATVASLAPPNLLHIVLNNGAHDSVGGQATVAQEIDLAGVARALGYPHSIDARTRAALRAALEHARDTAGPVLIDAHVRCGHRADLGRPTHDPREQRQRLMRTLGFV